MNKTYQKMLKSKKRFKINMRDILRKQKIKYKKKIKQKKIKIKKENKKKEKIQVKYDGYNKKKEKQVQRMINMEDKKIPKNIDYDDISGLATEAQDKLKNIQPLSIGQASRIAGVNPADISVLLVYIEQGKFETTTS